MTPAVSRFGIRWATWRTPSIRKRTTSSVLLRLDVDVARAFLGCLEDDRVDEPDDRRIGDAVVGLEVVLVVDVLVGSGRGVDERRVLRLGRPREAAQLREHVVLGSDVELDLPAGRETQLVEALHVLRVGDRDLQGRVVRGERDRAHALQHRQGDRLRRLGVDTRDREVDERQVVLLGERPGDAERTGEALVDQRLGECPANGTCSHLLDRLGRQKPCLPHQLRDELGVIAFVAFFGRPRLLRPHRAVDESKLRLTVLVHPRCLH